jgi:hypothetical protein
MKLRRVTPRLYVRVTGMMLAAVAFIIGGVIQYTSAAHVCASEETLQGTSCVLPTYPGQSLSTDVSSQISDDHTGGLVLIGLGVLLLVFGMVVIFSIYNFFADQRDEREAALEAGDLDEADALSE